MKGYQIKKLLTIIEIMGGEIPLMPRRYPDIDQNDKKNLDFCEFSTNSSNKIILAAMNMFSSVYKEVDERFKC